MNSKQKKQFSRLSPEAQARVMAAEKGCRGAQVAIEVFAAKTPQQQAAQESSISRTRAFEAHLEAKAANSALANDYRHAEADINRDIAYMRAKAGDSRFNKLSKF